MACNFLACSVDRHHNSSQWSYQSAARSTDLHCESPVRCYMVYSHYHHLVLLSTHVPHTLEGWDNTAEIMVCNAFKSCIWFLWQTHQLPTAADEETDRQTDRQVATLDLTPTVWAALMSAAWRPHMLNDICSVMWYKHNSSQYSSVNVVYERNVQAIMDSHIRNQKAIHSEPQWFWQRNLAFRTCAKKTEFRTLALKFNGQNTHRERETYCGTGISVYWLSMWVCDTVDTRLVADTVHCW